MCVPFGEDSDRFVDPLVLVEYVNAPGRGQATP
jgi:hypothetical protein